ncbi:MAG: hypothetical protein Q9164_003144 [Protoblastenia rupestris]
MPEFSNLPLGKEDPPYSAWGLYGTSDELGTLNRLTDKIVAKAAKEEIQSGVRQAFYKDIIHKAPRVANDDVWTFNTQSSTQWDGLRHVAYQKAEKFYNGVTLDDIHGVNKANVNGIHAWAEKGIVGCGILLDFYSWCSTNNIAYDPYAGQSITLDQLEAVAKAQGTDIKFGDILLIRSGYTAAFNQLSESQRLKRAQANPPTLSGVEQSEDTLEWIWNNFSAVAADIPAFERWPKSVKDWYFHEILLAGWGMPIGELFDLEKVAGHCKDIGRWSFFFTSEVCNVPGGIAR